MSKLFGTSPLELLMKDVSQLNFPQPNTESTSERLYPKGKSPRKFDREAVRLQLQAIISAETDPPLFMGDVAQQIGFDHSFLLKRLPDECRQISERYSAFQSLRSNTRRNHDCEIVIQATLDLHEGGVRPNPKQMKPEIRVLLKDELVRQAYRTLMQTLGYRKP
jgi:hypothetical protein